MNPQFYVDNEDGLGVSFDGFTVVLEAFALVQCGETYHIKLAVGDAGGSVGLTPPTIPPCSSKQAVSPAPVR